MQICYSDKSVSVERKIVVKYPEAEQIPALKKLFHREGRLGQGDVEIYLDLPDLSEGQARKIADSIVLALYEGAYKFNKECLRSWNVQSIFEKRDDMACYGDRVITLVSVVDLNETIKDSQMAARCIGYARSLGNLPHNYLQIPDMVRYAEKLAADCGLKCTILKDRELEAMGCGGILAVNQGSRNEAAMIVLEWGEAAEKEKKALVGKGIMFDAGGYNLKSSDAMRGMKFDMCGAANILESMEIAARTGYDGELTGVLALAENLVNSDAVKMGDVIHTLAGRSVEICNTDAEGRLVLCDALTYVQRQGAAQVVDLATLTGGCKGALGSETVGVFSNDENIYESFTDAMKDAGERYWRLPLGEIYREMLCYSDTADYANYPPPGSDAGASTAASFLEFFIEPETKWVHLDFVGPSVAQSDSEERAKGATGACMASIREWLMKQ